MTAVRSFTSSPGCTACVGSLRVGGREESAGGGDQIPQGWGSPQAESEQCGLNMWPPLSLDKD